MEIRYTTGGKCVGEFGLASNQYSKEKEVTLYVDVTCWEKQAEALSPYLKKGTFIVLSGRLKLNQWEKDGEKRSKLTVTAEEITLGPKTGDRQAQPAGAVANGAMAGPIEHPNNEDDVPF